MTARRTVAQAAAYLASAPKSNRVGAAYFAALAEIQEKGRLPVPLHLRPSATAGCRRSSATARATCTRLTSTMPTWSSSTCPTSSAAASSTSPPTRGWRRSSGSGSSPSAGSDSSGGAERVDLGGAADSRPVAVSAEQMVVFRASLAESPGHECIRQGNGAKQPVVAPAWPLAESVEFEPTEAARRARASAAATMAGVDELYRAVSAA